MKFHLCRAATALFVVALGVSSVSNAAIIGVTDSRVSGYFGTGCVGTPLVEAAGCAFQLSDPGQLWGPGVPLPPVGGAPVATPNVPFTYPFPRYYSGTDGAGTSTGTAIVGGYVLGGGNNNTSFIWLPQASYLTQQNFVPLGNAAITELNFSIDYAVDNGGLNGSFQTANWQLTGAVQAGGYANFEASMTYWDVTGAPVNLGSLNLSYQQNNTLGLGPVAFNQQLSDAQAIFGMGAGTMRITGFIQWEGDPMSMEITDNQAPPVPLITLIDNQAPPVPLPGAVWLFGSGLLGLIGVARRKARSA